jgi:Ca2+-transporting ATPase
MRTLAEIQKELPRGADNGLTSDGVIQSRQRFGINQLTPLPREPLWKKFIEKFDEPIIKILLAAALLSLVVDLFKLPDKGTTYGVVSLALVAGVLAAAYAIRKPHWVPSLMFGLAIGLSIFGLVIRHPLVEGLAVMIAVILATGVAFLSEYKSDREFEVLNAKKDALQVKVVRDGQFHTLPLEDVVVGDLVQLETGDEIPADGRLAKANDLYIDQSLMTGESVPVRKSPRPADDTAEGPDQPACLYRGTQVVDGVGEMVVTDVGDATALGQIARRLSAEDEEEEEEIQAADTEEKRVKRKLTISKELTPLQLKLTNLADLISKVGYVAAVLIFVAQVIRGCITGELHIPVDGRDAIGVLGALLDYFVLMVIIIVVAVPEGLPMSVTVSLALAMRKMTRANSLVRQLVACETIGSATVICSDKTGTLTQNKMQVVRLSWEGKVFDRAGPDWVRLDANQPWPRDGKPLDWIALIAAVNSTAHLEEKEGKTVVIGNNTEGALLQWLREGQIDYVKLRLQFSALFQIHFSSERKRMTTVIRYGDHLVTLAKGAPEWLLEQSTHYLAADGTVCKWSVDAKQALQDRLRDSTIQAMRTLAFGCAPLPTGTPSGADELHALRESLETGLIFVGFVAIRDPLREDVKDAVAKCRAAGIEVKMITGDNVETARAIGYDIGLIGRRDEPIDSSDGAILTSAKFNELSDEQLKSRLPNLRILARARPLDKFRMVKLLQELNEVVAVTGDGTNDAPALKKADVGLAMGIAGTEVSKEASKIVLLDDSFATIVNAVMWGRSLYENIQRFIQFQLTINVSALTIAFLGPLFFGIKAPFTVLQLLWINVIMDTFASIALCSEPPREGVMSLPPKRRDENILTPAMLRTIFITAGFFVVTMLGLLIAMKGNPEKPGYFAGNGSWSFETSGTRTAVSSELLERVDKREWTIKEDAGEEYETLIGRPGDVTFTVLQVSIFFSVYVFFQVWNQINCRSLVPEVSGFHKLLGNPAFLAIASTVAIGQIIIVSFGGNVFKVEPLSLLQWLAVAGFTMTVLVFAEVVRHIRLAREHQASGAHLTASAPR